jgi:HNH endonuclease
MAETESMGIRFTIDHYEPQSKRADLVHDYSNLLWACDPCNDNKGSDCPTDEMRARGYRYFRPDQDEGYEHFELTEDLFLTSKSNTGEYTINLVGLNRAMLLRLRNLRKRLYESSEIIARGRRALRGKSIDLFPPRMRLEVQETRNQLDDDASSLEGALCELNRSVLIDPDPAKKDRAKNRRKFLKKVRTICSEI